MLTAVIHKWSLRIALAPVLSLGMAAFVAGQESPATTRREPTKRSESGRESGRDAGQMKAQDAHFATCLMLGSQNEIAVAKLAESRTQSPEVKKFAQMMEKDHQKCLTDLEKFTGNQVPNRRAANEPQGETRRDSRDEKRTTDAGRKEGSPAPAVANNAARRDRNGNSLGGAPGMPMDMHMQIKQEIADECLASTETELSSKKGREFDACYIGMQICAHMYMIDEMKVLERHASPELQSVLQKGLEVTGQHLAKAKEIMKDIEKGKTQETTAK